MKNLIQRTITGALFISAIIGAIWCGEEYYLALFALASTLSLNEYYTLIKQEGDSRIERLFNLLGGLLLYGLITIQVALPQFASPKLLFAPYLIYFVCTLCNQLYAKEERPIDRWARYFLGHIYIVLPIGLLSYIAYPDIVGATHYTPLMLLAFFAFIWANDTGAYVVGVTFGKHRLFERISPKKSWEGFFGGVFFVLVAAAIFAHYVPLLNLYQWLGYALVVAIAATYGDLCESLLKRNLGVKDSGNLLPGHGGMLDRFDSVLLASPVAVIYLAYIL